MGKTILQEAEGLVSGDRQEDYGHPKQSMERIATFWSAVLEQEITPKQVCLCMIGLKLARLLESDVRDSLVDICGYAAIADGLRVKSDKEPLEPKTHCGFTTPLEPLKR